MVYPPSGTAIIAIALAAALADAAVVAGNLAGIEALVVFHNLFSRNVNIQ